MKYCTDDGKHIFNTEQELFDFEGKVKAEREERAKLIKEQQARKQAIKKDYESLLNSIAQYNKDYKEPIRFDSNATLGFCGYNPFRDILSSLLGW